MITANQNLKMLKELARGLILKKYNLFFITLLFLSLTPVIDIALYNNIIDTTMEGLANNNFTTENIVNVVITIFLLTSLTGLKYYFNIKRIHFINALTIHKKRQKKLNPVSENWYRASLIELTILLICASQIILVFILSLTINRTMGAFFALVILGTYLVIFRLFVTETNNQINYVKKSYISNKSLSGQKILSRVTRAEQSGLLGAIIMNLILSISFILFYNDHLSVNHFIIFVFISKYAGSMISTSASSLMRLSRSLAYTKNILLY